MSGPGHCPLDRLLHRRLKEQNTLSILDVVVVEAEGVKSINYLGGASAVAQVKVRGGKVCMTGQQRFTFPLNVGGLPAGSGSVSGSGHSGH